MNESSFIGQHGRDARINAVRELEQFAQFVV